jgi:hypothetical protein
MRHPDLDYLIVMERRKDELEAAARSRLLKEARAANREYNHQAAGFVAAPRPVSLGRRALRGGEALMLVLARFLSFTGEHLLTWSCRLQTRYEMLIADNISEHRASPCA